jgi:hypothetical protein
MKKRIYHFTIAVMALVSLNGCDLLERPTLTQMVDDNYWRNEADLRAYANGYYENYFVGYNDGWGTDFAPVRSSTFCDDFVSESMQSNFENRVPTSRGSSSESRSCMSEYYGSNWGFARIRKSNIFIDRIENVAKPNLTDEEYCHWLSVAYFFKAYEYADLVNVFGAMPWFEGVVSDTDFDTMYKDRDDRGMVMDKVYDLLTYVLDNMRLDDGTQYLNRYVAAGFTSRFMLNEGTWLKYHGGDQARAKKYLELAVRAAELVMDSEQWSLTADYKSLFASADLAGNPEVLMYRTYDSSLGIMHHIGSYNGGRESETGINLEYIKSFNLNDGKPYTISTVDGANDFSVKNLTLTRDPRFDANFVDRPHNQSSSLIYSYKYASREALDYYFSSGGDLLTEWSSQYNVNDAPIMRLGEIVLNWIEAKEELALSYSGTSITQADLDRSINALRDRPLDDAAEAKGVKKTAHLQLSNLPDDPVRDADVPALLWEIRRERRMELFYEGNRIKDLRRWGKLSYMNYDSNPDKYLGPWIDFPNEYPEYMNDMVGVLKVKHADGTVVTYDGSNADRIVGFYCVRNAVNREPFTERSYLAPIGQQQIDEYAQRGYTLTQTPLW